MARFTLAKEPHRLAGPLSSKIAQIRTRFRHARSSDIAIEPEEMDAIFENLDEMVGEAKTLEESTFDPLEASSRVAFELVCQTEDELRVVRHILTGMTHSPGEKAPAQAHAHFAAARALLEKAEAVFVGTAAS